MKKKNIYIYIYMKLQNAVTVPNIQIKPNEKPIKLLKKHNKPNFPGSGDLTGSASSAQPNQQLWVADPLLRTPVMNERAPFKLLSADCTYIWSPRRYSFRCADFSSDVALCTLRCDPVEGIEGIGSQCGCWRWNPKTIDVCSVAWLESEVAFCIKPKQCSTFRVVTNWIPLYYFAMWLALFFILSGIGNRFLHKTQTMPDL